MLMGLKVRRSTPSNKAGAYLTESFLAMRAPRRYMQVMSFPTVQLFSALAGAGAAFGLILSGAIAFAQTTQTGLAEPGASAWSPAPKSRARLVSAGTFYGGAYRAGIEIALDGNALTYWRNPGDAGVPPEFDFAASTNLAHADVAYPAPERHDEDGSEVFGWRRSVIFPLNVQPKDASKPVTLSLTLRYAACEKICIPSEGQMQLTLAPVNAPNAQAARIAQWASLVPRPAAKSGASIKIERVANADKPTWRVQASPAETGSDLFAEGDDGWFFDTRPAKSGAFKLSLAERPSGVENMTSVRLTLRRPSGAVEFISKLDAGKAAP